MKKQQVFQALICPLVLALCLVGLDMLTGGLAPSTAMPAEMTSQVLSAQRTSAQGWSSGWVAINPGQTITLTHDLGGAVEDYYVQLWFLDLPFGGYGIHNFGYGGLEAEGIDYGTYWENLTSTTINVVRGPNDGTADRVQVWIWTPSMEDEYCSNWSSIGQNDISELNHALGYDADDYTVQLWFKDSATGNIHQHGYGGLEVAGQRRGAYWLWLSMYSVGVYRYANDTYLDQYRICVGVPQDQPAYDSGWVSIGAGETLSLTHAVGGNVNGYFVDFEFKDLVALDTHIAGLGGDFYDPLSKTPATSYWGAYWQRLTTNTIEIRRMASDDYIDQVRVRIWQRTAQVFLPLVLNSP